MVRGQWTRWQTSQRKHSSSTHHSTLTGMVEPYTWVQRRTDRKIRSHHRHRETWGEWLLRRKSPHSAATVISFHESRPTRQRGFTLLGHTKPVIIVRVLSVRHTTRSRRLLGLLGSTADIGRHIDNTADSSADQCISVHHYCVHLVTRSRRSPPSAKHSKDTQWMDTPCPKWIGAKSDEKRRRNPTSPLKPRIARKAMMAPGSETNTNRVENEIFHTCAHVKGVGWRRSRVGL